MIRGYLPASPDADAITFAKLLALLGHNDDLKAKPEYVSICHKIGSDGRFKTDVCAHDDGPAFVETLLSATSGKADIWFGVNSVNGPARASRGRGKVADVLRLTSLWADFDIKAGGCPDLQTAHTIIAEVSGYLGERPSAITDSGHGLHPYWPIDRESADKLTNREAQQLVERFGRLVKAVAGQHGCGADSVFDLTRILRVPGTINNKYPDEPAPATCVADIGKPLTVEQIGQVLDEFGINEERSRARAGTTGQGPGEFSRRCFGHKGSPVRCGSGCVLATARSY